MIELRSDTFTLPTPKMLAAIAKARLGNDGYREDPTVLDLERLAATKLGKEAACLMPSGTMANLASVMAHCSADRKGVLVGDASDVYCYERSGSTCAGVVYCKVRTQADGTILIADLERQVKKNSAAGLQFAVLCLENPHNLCGGVILPPDYIEAVSDFVRSKRIRLHLDGARIFNASVARRAEAGELVKCADSVQFCLSKGLACPIGSVVVGTRKLVDKVRRVRKILGGTMRQSGIIAAPGIVALEQMVDRLKDDHQNARRMAEGLARLPGIEINLSTVQTNTVVFRVTDTRFTANTFIASAWFHGVRLSEFKGDRIRAVVHYGITETDIETAVQLLSEILKNGPITGTQFPASEDQ